ncbi:MAG: sigma-70 family RNA polymerase sigma factor [Clostridia bacterium]|nr:sigma-70 family RNA polymerase sigma factor [Clostridia bacterium]
MDDKKIIDLYWSRDEQAIDETKQSYGAYCFAIADNILGNSEDAEECVNDALLRVWESVPPRRPERLQSYIGAITRNLALNVYKRYRREKRGGGMADAVFGELEGCIPDTQSIEQHSDSAHIAEVISAHLRRLPAEQRLVFVRRYWYFDSIADIAQRYGMSESKVTSVLYRVRKSLKSTLEKEGVTI